MNIKIGDMLICKHSIGYMFIRNEKYKVENVTSHSTSNTTLPSEYWNELYLGRTKKLNLSEENLFYTITLEGGWVSSFEVFNFFYTKQEERRMKLKNIKK
jgi:hypothetical protein